MFSSHNLEKKPVTYIVVYTNDDWTYLQIALALRIHKNTVKRPINDYLSGQLKKIDSVHPTQSTKLSNGWIKKGTNKAIDTTASRTRINIVGAINLAAIEKAVVSNYETVNAETIVEHFETIRETSNSEGTIHIILEKPVIIAFNLFKKNQKS